MIGPKNIHYSGGFINQMLRLLSTFVAVWVSWGAVHVVSKWITPGLNHIRECATDILYVYRKSADACYGWMSLVGKPSFKTIGYGQTFFWFVSDTCYGSEKSTQKSLRTGKEKKIIYGGPFVFSQSHIDRTSMTTTQSVTASSSKVNL